jgi:hypothetical protein
VTAQELDQMSEYWRSRYTAARSAEIGSSNQQIADQREIDEFNRMQGH